MSFSPLCPWPSRHAIFVRRSILSTLLYILRPTCFPPAAFALVPSSPIMLVLHPTSTCDVCLEGYYGTNDPHAIVCGHIFCLRCLQSLTRQCCPLCRTSFHPLDVRKLHVDKTRLPPSTPPPNPANLVELPSHARELQDQITRVVLKGAKTFSEVHDLIDEHADLRAAHLLLYRYADAQLKAAEDKDSLAKFDSRCQELIQNLQTERELSDARCEELSNERFEKESALAREKSLQEHYDLVEKEWKEKYEACVEECRQLQQELEQLKCLDRSPSPSPKATEGRYIYFLDQSNPEPMVVDASDSFNAVKVAGKTDMFRLSPIPPTIPELPSSLTQFQPLTDDHDEHDDDSGKCARSSPYTPRNIQPIPIRSTVRREPSSCSLLSRYDTDVVSHSLPRGYDIHMASCSSSPTVSTIRDRNGDFVSSSLGRGPEGIPGLRSTGARRTPDCREQEEQRRAQLRDVLQHPTPSATNSPRRNTVSETDSVRRNIPIPPTSAPRAPSPSSSSSVSGSPPHNTAISHASTAAKAAERARVQSNFSPSVASPAYVSHITATRDNMTPPQIYAQPRPENLRRLSTDSMKGKSAPPSNLARTRTLWTVQDTPAQYV
ncbi:hypothetical protein A0H81_01986 [Grifola frondosa]|uniref:RING-type domain-containing protein n=1 Tax=Grifola frondosa TaxID=5627 RepID=A0A1C7MPL7_GRIFR|nr:hypothetical protein A0H81_01986 [Grifola frondosa]